MGRNRSAVSGLSRFIQVLKESETVNTDDDALSPSIAPNPDHLRSPESIDYHERPAKKRKIGLLGAGNEKYDATSLVQFYINPSEVPEHLKKCKQPPTPILHTSPQKIRFSTL
jgi:trimethylguanosine synthase